MQIESTIRSIPIHVRMGDDNAQGEESHRERLIRFLKRIEWNGNELWGDPSCPSCCQFDGHADDCELIALLELLEAQDD